MAIASKRQAAIPSGNHTGEIVRAEEVQKDFGEGPETVVEIELRADYEDPTGAEVLNVSVIFPPVLNGLSALSQLLTRLGTHPADGESWVPETLVGTPVAFEAFKADNGFTRVKKDSIRAA